MSNRITTIIVPGLITLCLACWITAAVAEDAPTPPPVQEEVTLGLGGLHQDIEGNERRFDQYVIPPSDIFVPWASWRRFDVTGGPTIDLRGWEIDDTGGYADGFVNWGEFNAEARFRDSNFFYDFVPGVTQSEREDIRGELYPKSSASRRLTWRLAGNEVRWQGMSATTAFDWRDRNGLAGVGWRAGSHWLDASFNRESFDQRVGPYFSGDTSTVLLSFSPAAFSGGGTQISGSFARYNTNLDGFATDLKSSTAQLAVQRPFGSKWDARGTLRYFNVEDTIAQNAYADNQLQGRLEVEFRPDARTRLSGFWSGTTTDYVDGRHLNVVETTQNAFGVRGTTRIGRYLKFAAGFRNLDNFDRPLSYTSGGALANTLLWSDVERYDASATYTPSPVWGASASFQRRLWRNDAQGTSNSMDAWALTGWWQALDNLTLNAAWLKQDFSSPFVDLLTLQRFASDATSLVLGGNLALSPEDSLYASITHVDTSDFVDNLYDRFTIGATHVVGPQDRVLAEANFHEFTDDNVSLLDYEANLYRFEWEHQF